MDSPYMFIIKSNRDQAGTSRYYLAFLMISYQIRAVNLHSSLTYLGSKHFQPQPGLDASHTDKTEAVINL